MPDQLRWKGGLREEQFGQVLRLYFSQPGGSVLTGLRIGTTRLKARRERKESYISTESDCWEFVCVGGCWGLNIGPQACSVHALPLCHSPSPKCQAIYDFVLKTILH